MTDLDTLLPFWVETLARPGLSWRARFQTWRCHPQDERFSHLESAVTAARAAAIGDGGKAMAPDHQLPVIVCLSHSEDLEDHELALDLLANWEAITGNREPELAALLQERHEVVRQFGRFPARNRLLRRPSSPTEAYFMLGAGQQYL